MPEMTDYNFAMCFWSTVAAASFVLPLALAFVREHATPSRTSMR